MHAYLDVVVHMNFDHAWVEHYPVTVMFFVGYIIISTYMYICCEGIQTSV